MYHYNKIYEVDTDSAINNTWHDTIKLHTIKELSNDPSKGVIAFSGAVHGYYPGCDVEIIKLGNNSFDIVSRYDISTNKVQCRVIAYKM